MKYDLEQLWDATNDGYTIFADEFAAEIARNRGQHKGFAVRPEDKTGSCHLYQSRKSGKWLFTDFGVSDKGVNAIDYFCQRNGWDFVETCQYLFGKYGIPVAQHTAVLAPQITFGTKPVEQHFFALEFFPEVRQTPTLLRIFPFFDAKIFSAYQFKEIKSYQTTYFNKELQAYCIKETRATDEFPIYGYDFGDFVKIYQPNAPKGDKYIFKHSFVGVKPKEVVYGLQNLMSGVDLHVLEKLENEFSQKSDPILKKDLQDRINAIKLPYLVIATGGTDGLNMASLGASVVWYNSETQLPSRSDMELFERVAKEVYYLPDLDATGVKQGVEMGMTYLNVKLVWLPEQLLSQHKKDFRDWGTDERFSGLETLRYKFHKMLSYGLNFKFWERSKQGISINYKKLIHFLYRNNFYRYKMPFYNEDSSKEDSGCFVHLQDNVVEFVETSDIKILY